MALVALACVVAGAPAAASADPVLAAVGDIACHPGDADTTHDCQQASTAALVAGEPHDAVAVLGDNQYDSGTFAEYSAPAGGANGLGGYDATWGQFNSIVHPELGNHEYAVSPTAAGYFQYFGGVGVTTGGSDGYYSYDLGAWHIVALNSNCSDIGCSDDGSGSATSAEVNWLTSDLAAPQNQHKCLLAYWHHPRFTSGSVGESPGVGPLWNALYAAHADVVLNGHDHLYERFTQMDPSGNPTPQGIREFVVGTGGEDLVHANPGYLPSRMQAVDDHDFGVMFLTLHAHSYDWTMRAAGQKSVGTGGTPAAAGTVLDSGSTSCHSAPAVTTTTPPRSLSAKASPRRARRLPFRYTFSGRLSLPAGITAKAGCSGAVSIQIKSARRTISSRRAAVSRSCTYKSTVAIRTRKHLKAHGTLKVTVSFLGNAVLAKKTHPALSVLYG